MDHGAGLSAPEGFTVIAEDFLLTLTPGFQGAVAVRAAALGVNSLVSEHDLGRRTGSSHRLDI